VCFYVLCFGFLIWFCCMFSVCVCIVCVLWACFLECVCEFTFLFCCFVCCCSCMLGQSCNRHTGSRINFLAFHPPKTVCCKIVPTGCCRGCPLGQSCDRACPRRKNLATGRAPVGAILQQTVFGGWNPATFMRLPVCLLQDGPNIHEQRHTKQTRKLTHKF